MTLDVAGAIMSWLSRTAMPGRRGPTNADPLPLARARRWKRMLEDGKYRSSGGLAEAEGEAIWRAARETIDAWKS